MEYNTKRPDASLFSASNLAVIPERRLSSRTHGFGAAAAVVGLGVANAVLNHLYAASGHPVDYATGQTSFSAERIKGWYGEMAAGGTLDVYLATQLFDYVFILTVLATGALGATFLARKSVGRCRAAALWAAAMLATGAGLDAIENLISFVMLADREGFPAYLAVAYSSIAVAKFAFIASAMGLLVFSLLGTGVRGAVRLVSAERSAVLPMA